MLLPTNGIPVIKPENKCIIWGRKKPTTNEKSSNTLIILTFISNLDNKNKIKNKKIKKCIYIESAKKINPFNNDLFLTKKM